MQDSIEIIQTKAQKKRNYGKLKIRLIYLWIYENSLKRVPYSPYMEIHMD